MKNQIRIHNNLVASLVMLLLLVGSTGCDTLNNQESEVATLSEADLEAASSIMAESMSDQNEGLMANLNDMTASVDVQGISYSDRAFDGNPLLRPCRGLNRSFEKTYEPSTGTHTINYTREHQGETCSKFVEVNLNYVFIDSLGGYIAAPRINKGSVAEIAFVGTRSGNGSFTSRRGTTRSKTFDQSGEWNLTGLQSNVASLTGSQVNDGTYEFTRQDTTGREQVRTGEYHVEFNTVDVTISKADANTDLEHQITGSIQYTMTMTRTVNGTTETKEVEGTVELQGNGRALLRFNGLRQLYRLHLSDGEVEITNSDG